MWRRTVGLVACGGLVFQVTGCSAPLAPIVFSLVESAVVSAVTGALFAP